MQAIQLTKYGKPEEGLRLVEIADPGDPKSGQILIRVEYAPINDSDLLVASGLYAVQPKLPSVVGRSLESSDPNGRLELVVVDTEGCPSLYELPEFVGKLHGHGEAAWVLEGKIVNTSGLGYHPECMEPNTLLLLSQCPVE
jgi:hypothetical protein